MATVTVTFVSNTDGTMTVKSTDTAGLNMIVSDPRDHERNENAHWAARSLKNFILAQLYP